MAEEEAMRQREIVEQKNIALRELLNMAQSQKAEVAEKIMADLQSFVLPLVSQMKILKSFQPQLLRQLEENISDLTLPLGKSRRELFQMFSQKESEIARMIQSGHSTKEIASLCNLSLHTVATYRNRVRKKLGIKNGKVNLVSHLKALSLK